MAVKPSVVSVGTSATQLSSADTDAIPGESVAVYNNSGSTIYLGDASVTSSNGLPLVSGVSSYLTVDLPPNSVLYACTASGTANVNVLAIGA